MNKKALVIVDVQNDFANPKGSLYVKGGEKIASLVNSIAANYDMVVATRDWHPPGHISFGVWPQHCVAGEWGAQLDPQLDETKIHAIINKGLDLNVDSYSGVKDNEGGNITGLHRLLSGMNKIDVVGIAFDYCVKFTAIDLKKSLTDSNVDIIVHKNMTASVNPQEDSKNIAELNEAGVAVI